MKISRLAQHLISLAFTVLFLIGLTIYYYKTMSLGHFLFIWAVVAFCILCKYWFAHRRHHSS